MSDWESWRNYVLSSIEHIEQMDKELLEIQKIVAELRVKNSVFSVIAGIISGSLAAIVAIITRN